MVGSHLIANLQLNTRTYHYHTADWYLLFSLCDAKWQMDLFFFVMFVVFSRIISVVFKTITFCNEQGRLKQYLSMKEEHKNTRFQMHTRIYYIIMKYNIMNTFSKKTKQYVMMIRSTKYIIYDEMLCWCT